MSEPSDDWRVLMELDAQSPDPSPWPSWLYWVPRLEAAQEPGPDDTASAKRQGNEG